MKFISASSFIMPAYLPPSAWLQHIPFSFWLVEQLQPKLVVELGVHYGASYFAFCQGMKANDIQGTCYGIDSWQGDSHAGHYDEKIYHAATRYNEENYAGFSYLVKSAFEDSLQSFEDHSIDLLHIDGLHLYESVKRDFEHWLPKLSEKAVVLFHDTCVRERDFGVYKLWDELVRQYIHFEFSFGFGLGVLGVGSNIPATVKSLLFLSETHEKHEVNEIYAGLGSRVLNNFKLSEAGETIRHQQEKIDGLEMEIRNKESDIADLKATLAIQREFSNQVQLSHDEEMHKKNLLHAEFLYIKERHDSIQTFIADRQETIRSLQAEQVKKEMLEKELEKMDKTITEKQSLFADLQNEHRKLWQLHYDSVTEFQSALDKQVALSNKLLGEYHAVVERERQGQLLAHEGIKTLAKCENETALLNIKVKELEKMCDHLRKDIAIAEIKYHGKTVMEIFRDKLNRPNKNGGPFS